ncbi:8913_t:CDS:2 [Diversispora eburnea]|uniref:8913_t:CDS:1 n=1 Tax=Diversispora eburnea TaxID=1213867 RepID=A0A9N8W168_9GLOM|nr:8913_t:CDS:2 [Diversispora eburnea]
MERRDILRRRPMLQLDQPISSIRAKNKAADEAKKRQESKNVLQELLGEYSESDDEENEEISQIEFPSKGKDVTVSLNSPLIPSIPPAQSHSPPTSEQSITMDLSEDSIETALKNFMSEINALPITSINNDSSVTTSVTTVEDSNSKPKNDKAQFSSQIFSLENDWQEHWNQENNSRYFYNSKTGETRWEVDIQKNIIDSTISKEKSDNLETTSNDSYYSVPYIATINKDESNSLTVPSPDSPLHHRSRDIYVRLSSIMPLVTHMKLERHQIEFATRLHDWQIGALQTVYFEKTILEGLEMLLQGLEEQISPAGWTCKWNSETQKHTWIHLQTNQISYTYPNPDFTSSLSMHNNSVLVNHQDYVDSNGLDNGLDNDLDARFTSSLVTSSQYNLQSYPVESEFMTISIIHFLNHDDGAISAMNSQASTGQGLISTVTSEKKRKKEKETLSSGFKNKKMANLVEKWKAAEDFLANTDWEEIRKQQNGTIKDSEAWIREQIESGEASNNPNLEPIKGDWRQRIKNKKSDKD